MGSSETRYWLSIGAIKSETNAEVGTVLFPAIFISRVNWSSKMRADKPKLGLSSKVQRCSANRLPASSIVHESEFSNLSVIRLIHKSQIFVWIFLRETLLQLIQLFHWVRACFHYLHKMQMSGTLLVVIRTNMQVSSRIVCRHVHDWQIRKTDEPD